MRHTVRTRLAAEHGFTMVDMLVSTAITTVVLGATMSVLMGALRANDTGLRTTQMNQTLRAAMDMIVRDLLQVGQSLPAGRSVFIPSGTGTQPVLLPGPPGSAFKTPAGTTKLAAIIPWPEGGHLVDGVKTDVVTMLAGDGAFDHVPLTALNSSSMTVATKAIHTERGVTIGTKNVDDLAPGQLIMLEKGTKTTLVQVTKVDGTQTVQFATLQDSLGLNQNDAATGSVSALLAAAPPDVVATTGYKVIPTTATRIRMITYYIDALTTPGRPRLVRRMNNGDAAKFDNNLGAAVAFDVTNLQVTYDLAGAGNPTNVRMTASDLTDATNSACAPEVCSGGQVRKVNIALTGTAPAPGTGQLHYSTLTSQVSLRSMALVDRYR